MMKSSPVPSSWLEDGMNKTLERRAQKGSLRVYDESLDTAAAAAAAASESSTTMDFSSNDYLGLARSKKQQHLVESRYQSLLLQASPTTSAQPTLGATGSRLLSGDSAYARQLEAKLAEWHHRPSALICNSGYDANLAVLSSLPCDRFVFDEYAHNSLHMGMRLSRRFRDKHDELSGSFLHNNVNDLHCKLTALHNNNKAINASRPPQILIVVESVYSMDGDVAPLKETLDLAQTYGALVMVDEAHGLGIYGDDYGEYSRGVGVLAQLGLEHHPALACSVHTFGKAAGCHGAVVCGSKTLRQYLWNYGWPLIYSTSLPLHSLVAIECSYETMTSPRGNRLRQHTNRLVHYFRQLVEERILSNTHAATIQCPSQNYDNMYLLPSMSPIQALVLPQNGNQACTEFCHRLWDHSGHTLRLYPIKSPTVPAGQERIRIILHGHNTQSEVNKLVDYMVLTLIDMGLVSINSGGVGSKVARLASKL